MDNVSVSAVDGPLKEVHHEPTDEQSDVLKWNTSDDTEMQFDVQRAWDTLLTLPTCQQMLLSESVQKRLNIKVGVNVSQEFPWKQIKFIELQKHLFDYIDNGAQLMHAFAGYNPNNYVLIGYVATLGEKSEKVIMDDPFVLYINTDDVKTALTIIHNIELYEKWVIAKRLVKRPRRWITLGSENEVNLTLQRQHINDIDVEVQSMYAKITKTRDDLQLRSSEDVRDGCVELVPLDPKKFDNVIKRRVTQGVQSAPLFVDLTQQTDLTFPKNAWSQYLFEVNDKDVDMDDAAPTKGGGPNAEEAAIDAPIELSDQVKLLLKTLEFSQVDMYRNDYLSISEKDIKHYTNPYLEEKLCFTDISKNSNRFVCSVDWYPGVSGLAVVSYCFDAPGTVKSVSDDVNVVRRATMQPNPVLMWSFSDNLNYRLEFESPVEVTTLSFCPHNFSLLIGGTKTGQLMIWDLQKRVQKFGNEAVLTATQAKYRMIVSEFLSWTVQIDSEILISPSLTTPLETSQKSTITGIYWMGKNQNINNFGKLRVDDKAAAHKYFITCSTDGTIAYWNLDAIGEKKTQGQHRKPMPKALLQDESEYRHKSVDPLFLMVYNEPITNFIGDTSILKYIASANAKDQSTTNPHNFPIETETEDPPEARQVCVVSTLFGHVAQLSWLGAYSDTDGREELNQSNMTNFARIHNGPVLALKKNPFLTSLFASIGRNVFAVWSEDYCSSPIFWRKCACDITAVAWSEDRAGVLYITKVDGYCEVWDILVRDDDACLNEILGGGIVTAISEHRPAEPEKLLGIGDYNSSFRMVKLPKAFYIPLPNERHHLKTYVKKELSRKKAIQEWAQGYYANNADVIEAKRQAEIHAIKEAERIEKENVLKAARKAKAEEAASKTAAEPTSRLTYTERMKRQWDDLNLSRLLSILMSRKRVNTEQLEIDTALERTRLAYESAKKASYARVVERMGENVANIRARILPATKPDIERYTTIAHCVEKLLQQEDDYGKSLLDLQTLYDRQVDFSDVGYLEFLKRGAFRRRILNKSLGGNTERELWYDVAKQTDTLNECTWAHEYMQMGKRAAPTIPVNDETSLQPYDY